MSGLSREAMMELMAYADGELDDAAATERVEALVQANDEARRIVDAMRSLGDVVRGLPEADGPVSAVADAIADGVMAKIDAAPAVPVIPLASRRRIGRAHYAAAATAALALAAGVALLLHTNGPVPAAVATDDTHERPPQIQPAAPAPGATDLAPSPAASVAQNADDKNGEVDLEEVESADHHVSVFYVPKSITGAAAAHAGASVVVWIDDHGGH